MFVGYISAVENNSYSHHSDIITVHCNIIKHVDKQVVHAAGIPVEDSVEVSDIIELYLRFLQINLPLINSYTV